LSSIDLLQHAPHFIPIARFQFVEPIEQSRISASIRSATGGSGVSAIVSVARASR